MPGQEAMLKLGYFSGLFTSHIEVRGSLLETVLEYNGGLTFPLRELTGNQFTQCC